MASGRVPKIGIMLGTVSPKKEQACEDRDVYILPELGGALGQADLDQAAWGHVKPKRRFLT